MITNRLFSLFFTVLVILAFPACNDNIITTADDPGIIHISVLYDGTPLVDDYIHLDRADPDMPGLLIMLENPWLYDEGSIVWRLSGSIVGNGNECFIDAFEFKNLGFYYVSLSVRTNGVPFNRTFTVIVFNSDEEEEDDNEE